MRRAAAEARRVLLEMASTRFGVPVDQLAVSEGVITVKADPSKHVTYGDLIGGQKFNVTLSGNNAATSTVRQRPRRSPSSNTRANPRNATTSPQKWTAQRSGPST